MEFQLQCSLQINPPHSVEVWKGKLIAQKGSSAYQLLQNELQVSDGKQPLPIIFMILQGRNLGKVWLRCPSSDWNPRRALEMAVMS